MLGFFFLKFHIWLLRCSLCNFIWSENAQNDLLIRVLPLSDLIKSFSLFIILIHSLMAVSSTRWDGRRSIKKWNYFRQKTSRAPIFRLKLRLFFFLLFFIILQCFSFIFLFMLYFLWFLNFFKSLRNKNCVKFVVRYLGNFEFLEVWKNAWLTTWLHVLNLTDVGFEHILLKKFNSSKKKNKFDIIIFLKITRLFLRAFFIF